MTKYKRYLFLFLFCVSWSFQAQELEEVRQSLIGKHDFGVQFIWDGYGTATITEEDGTLRIKGEQYSSSKEEYVLLEGTITILDARSISFDGHLKLFTEGCCGLLDRRVTYTFRKTGNRKYWRLKDREDLCGQYTCAYYLDIFD